MTIIFFFCEKHGTKNQGVYITDAMETATWTELSWVIVLTVREKMMLVCDQHSYLKWLVASKIDLK